MASIGNAMCQIASDDFACGFEELAAAYSEGQHTSAALESLKVCFWIPMAILPPLQPFDGTAKKAAEAA